MIGGRLTFSVFNHIPKILRILARICLFLWLLNQIREIHFIIKVEVCFSVIAHIFIFLLHLLQLFVMVSFLLKFLIFNFLIKGLHFLLFGTILFLQILVVKQKIFDDSFMDFVFGQVHIITVGDCLEAVVDKHI